VGQKKGQPGGGAPFRENTSEWRKKEEKFLPQMGVRENQPTGEEKIMMTSLPSDHRTGGSKKRAPVAIGKVGGKHSREGPCLNY